MKITEMAARLRKTAVDMEAMAAKEGDLDFADEAVLPFIINAFTDNKAVLGFSTKMSDVPKLSDAAK